MKIYKTIVFLLVVVLLSAKVNALSINTCVENCGDYEEYCDYIAENELPENFVPFERFSFVGEFDSFWHEFYPETPEVFGYNIQDAGVLYVYDLDYHMNRHNPYEGYTELSSMTGPDLTSCGKSGKYRFRIGNCVYLYRAEPLWNDDSVWIDGYISYIYIECDELLLCWQVPVPRTEDSDLSSFSEDSFLYQMLNLETAEAAGERLVSAISGEPKERVSLLWLALPVGAVVIVVGTAFVLIRKKRKSSPNP